MPAKLFTSDLRILDGERICFDGAQYLVRIKPFERGLVDVRVVLLDSFGDPTSVEWNTRAKNTDEAVNMAVWNCLGEIDTQGEAADLPQFRDFDYERFDCQR